MLESTLSSEHKAVVMGKERFSVEKKPAVLVTECKGDLVVRPWMELDVLAKGEFVAEETADLLTLEGRGDLVLNVPEGTSLRVNHGRGDVVIRSISGEISLENVSGDLVLNNLGAAKVGHVSGDLVASNLSGALSVQNIDGDLVSRNVDGDLSLEHVKGDVMVQFVNGSLSFAEVSGDINLRGVNGNVAIKNGKRDLNLRSIGGQCLIENIAGDIRLMGGLGPFAHSLTAKGDFVLIWPLEAPLLLEAEASSIENRLPLVDVVEEKGKLNGRLGDGKTRVSIHAGGRLILKEAQMISKKWTMSDEELFNFDFLSELSELGTNFGAKISSMINDEVTQDAARKMAEEFSQKAGKAAEKAAEMAGLTAERIFEHTSAAQQKKKSAKETALNKSKSSTEAQLKILKMVEQGTISPDEANMLLDALEGD
jgi:hypothetical protein